MRELTDQTKPGRRRRVSRTYRRAILASALMLAASSVTADNNPYTTTRVNSPAPKTTAPTIQRNPFFDKFASDSAVQLASGNDKSTIRLKPIGAAVGLQPIGSDAISVRPPAMTIATPSQGKIQANPLIVSEPDSANHLVPTEVASASDRHSTIQLKRRVSNQSVPLIPTGADPSVTSILSKPAMIPVPKLQPEAVSQSPAEKQTPEVKPEILVQQQAPIIPPAPTTTAPATPPAPTGPVAEEPVLADSVAKESTKPSTVDVVTSIPPKNPKPAALQPIKGMDGEEPLAAAPEPTATVEPNSQPQTQQVAESSSDKEPKLEEADSQPVFFSLSDTTSRIDPPVVAGDTAPKPAEQDLVDDIPQPVIVTNPLVDLAQPPVLSAEPAVVDVEPAPVVSRTPVKEPNVQEPTEPAPTPAVQQLPLPILIAEVQPEHLPSESQGEPVSIVETSPAQEDGVVSAAPSVLYGNPTDADRRDREDRIVKKRYRPPVAVDAPGLAIERSVASRAVVASRRIVDTTSNPQVEAIAKDSGSTKLHMTRAQVRSLTLGGEVRRVSVGNRNVCQAVATGPNQLKLIGLSNGVTQLVVWADKSSESPTVVRTFEIHVDDAFEATGSTPGNKVQLLNQSIDDAFPGIQVKVQQVGRRLVVTGHCNDEETATKIMRMVRKTCLIPVQDKIKVR